MPPAGVGGRLGAVCGLPLSVVDHCPTFARLDSERSGIAVAGLGHAGHRAQSIAELCHLPANWVTPCLRQREELGPWLAVAVAARWL
jgi:hypothetical protein